MISLAGETAFLALRESLEGKCPPEQFICTDIPFERLRLGIISQQLSEVDRVARLRHALRYADLTLQSIGRVHALPLPNLPGWPNDALCRKFGLWVRPGSLVEASPWRPDWLSSVPIDGADATAMKAESRSWQHRLPTADPFITAKFGFENYKGPGQALAVRCALHQPHEKTLLVLLPTGEGKSLVFESIAAANPGKTTVVIVPTVALAINHAESAEQNSTLATGYPRAYVGGRPEQHDEILTRIENGQQGLLFAAPEAVVKRLRNPLLKAARSGLLAAVVIDESHLVNAWGTDFRAEFQSLAALVAEVREVCGVHPAPKVVCLSATVTQQSLKSMEKLFSPQESMAVIPAARLRPEPDIYIASVVQDSLRKDRVLEALRHLPRPAILYVTKKDDAVWWRDLLHREGFRNLAMVHGDTDTLDRERAVEAWRKGKLDLVVGTSAFGLGIDYPHVRSVVHACLPESLDRYYQEIGRSGRDNLASTAVLMPTASDFGVARRLAMKKVITINKGFSRWKAMFRTGVRDKDHPLRFVIDTTTSPSYDPDMKSDKNEGWNGRVLNLMALSGLIRLVGLRFDPETKQNRIAVDILHDGHLLGECWQTLVEQTRKSILRENFRGFELMKKLASDQSCPSRLFSQLYQLKHDGQSLHVLEACGGCSHCRQNNNSWYAHWPNAFSAPWAIGFVSEVLHNLLDNGFCLVERENDSPKTSREKRRLREMVQRIWQAGVRKCLVVGELPDYLADALAERPWCISVADNDRVLSSNGLPPGPEFVWVSPEYNIRRHHLTPRSAGNERIFVLSPQQKDLNNPGDLLWERMASLSIHTFQDRLVQ